MSYHWDDFLCQETPVLLCYILGPLWHIQDHLDTSPENPIDLLQGIKGSVTALKIEQKDFWI